MNSNLASQIGLVKASVAGAVWKFSRLKNGVCQASAGTIGEQLGLERTTVHKALKALDSEGWIIDVTPNARNRTHHYKPTVDLINSLCSKTVDLINTDGDSNEETVDLINSNEEAEQETVDLINSDGPENDETVDLITPTVDLITQKESLKDFLNTTSPNGDDGKPSPTKKNKNSDSKKSRASPEELREDQLVFATLADLCGYDLGIITQDDRGKLNQAGKLFRRRGHTVQDLNDFRDYWYSQDWRGKKNQPPTLSQIRETWGNFKKWHGDHETHQPDQIDDRREQIKREIAKRKAEQGGVSEYSPPA